MSPFLRLRSPSYSGAAMAFAVVALLASPTGMCAASETPAASLSSYRGFQFGTTLDSVLLKLQADKRDVRIVHSRPAMIQELEWSPGYTARHSEKDPDPVRTLILRFYNQQLFQVISSYARERVEGLTEADLIEVLSRDYGTATSPGGVVPYRSSYGDVAPVLAQWQDPAHTAHLVRSPDGYSFALILTAVQMNTAARGAIAEAHRLDDIEAPLRAVEIKSKRAADEREALDKARSTNMPNFRP